MNLVLAAEGGFHVPPLEELFVFDPIFGEGLLAFNRVSLLYLLSAGIIAALMVAAFKDPQLVPGKLQNSMESIVTFVREQIALEVIGPDGLKFVPLLTSLFLFIFVNNFFEVTPLIQMPSTGRMAAPAFLAIVVWVLYLLVGMKAQGVWGYWKNAMVGVEMPLAVRFIYVPVELAQLIIVRPLTLAIRLFANMMAGHILLTVVFLAANAFLIDFHDLLSPGLNVRGFPIGLVALAGAVAMVAFELLVSFLQAYIFTILTAVYIGGSLHPEH